MAKFTKIGTIMKKDGKPFVVLGNTHSTNKKFNYDVEITVKDSDGNVVAKAKNGFLSLKDPRENPNLKEGQLEKIPEHVKHELILATDD